MDRPVFSVCVSVLLGLSLTGCLSARPTTVEALAPRAELRLTSDHGFDARPASAAPGTVTTCRLRRLDGRLQERRADTLIIAEAFAVAHAPTDRCQLGATAAVVASDLEGVRVETAGVDVRRTARLIALSGLVVLLVLGSFATPGG